MNEADLFLLNASNHKYYCAYPYAFVQLHEVSHRFGIKIKTADLFGIHKGHWAHFVQERLNLYCPKMIGITIRNADSFIVSDYFQTEPQHKDYPHQRSFLEEIPRLNVPYLPAHDTKCLIDVIRSISNLPIVVGGYGFSMQPVSLMKFLKSDFGVQGDPDDFFRNFESVCLNRSLDNITNLLYLENGEIKSNSVSFFDPAPTTEYNSTVIEERNHFISNLSAPTPSQSRAIPIEISRGCPHSCYFCSETLVKGSNIRYRDQEIIEAEIEFLSKREMNTYWFVCSESNAGGNDWVLQLAEMIIKINERRLTHNRVRWYSYYLPKFSRDELCTLRRSGFLGGWNEIISLDDEILSKNNTPYTSADLTRFLQDVHAVHEMESNDNVLQEHSLNQRILEDCQHTAVLQNSDRFSSKLWSVFLGAPFSTPDSIRNTLDKINSEKLAQQYDLSVVIRATRVFTETALEDSFSPKQMLSYTQGLDTAPIDYINPTFMFPKQVVEQLGSFQEVNELFILIENTYLSRHHLFRKAWRWFLCEYTSVDLFHDYLCQALQKSEPDWETIAHSRKLVDFLYHLSHQPSHRKTNLLFNPPPGQETVFGSVAKYVIEFVVDAFWAKAIPVLDIIGLPINRESFEKMSEYSIAKSLYSHFDNRNQIILAVKEKLQTKNRQFEILFVEYLLYKNNVVLKPNYRIFFVDEHSS